MPTISEIETAIMDRLKERMPYLKTIGALNDMLTNTADSRTLIAPAAYVVYQSGKYANVCMNSGASDKTMKFSVIVMVRNMAATSGSQKKLLHGASVAKLGAYQLLEDARLALQGQSLGLSIVPLIPIDETAVDGDSNCAVYGITFGTECRVTGEANG